MSDEPGKSGNSEEASPREGGATSLSTTLQKSLQTVQSYVLLVSNFGLSLFLVVYYVLVVLPEQASQNSEFVSSIHKLTSELGVIKTQVNELKRDQASISRALDRVEEVAKTIKFKIELGAADNGQPHQRIDRHMIHRIMDRLTDRIIDIMERKLVSDDRLTDTIRSELFKRLLKN